MASAAQRRIKSISYAKYGYFFIAPFFLVYAFFQIWPLINTFILSVYGNGSEGDTFVGLQISRHCCSEAMTVPHVGFMQNLPVTLETL